MFSDCVLTILSNKNNPVDRVSFLADCFPTSLGSFRILRSKSQQM